MQRLKTIWISLGSSLWFIPSGCVLVAVGLASGLVWLDATVALGLDTRWPRLFGAGTEASRTLLSAIATSMITLAGVTFSITIVALSLAANQYTPRVLRNFMRDKGNQIVLGTFVSIFVYCLLVLRTVHSEQNSPFIPYLAIVAAIGLALLGIAVFIYFIHHVAASIQVSSILAGVLDETVQAVESLFPERVGNEQEELEGTEAEKALICERRWQPIPSASSGYIQSVASESLPKLAAKAKLIIRMEKTVGEFVSEGAPIAWVTPPQESEEATVRSVNRLFALNSYRTIEQDPGFGIRQVVDIALKALSPGINDPTTAVSCLDHLEPILRRLVQRQIPSPFRYYEGELRVIARGPTFSLLLDQMFDEIRVNAGSSAPVICRILDLFADVAGLPMMESRRQKLWTHARLVVEQADEQVRSPHDRATINEHAQRAAEALIPHSDAAAVLLRLRREPNAPLAQ
jgi:uncharacterized membrane protein